MLRFRFFLLKVALALVLTGVLSTIYPAGPANSTEPQWEKYEAQSTQLRKLHNAYTRVMRLFSQNCASVNEVYYRYADNVRIPEEIGPEARALFRTFSADVFRVFCDPAAPDNPAKIAIYDVLIIDILSFLNDRTIPVVCPVDAASIALHKRKYMDYYCTAVHQNSSDALD